MKKVLVLLCLCIVCLEACKKKKKNEDGGLDCSKITYSSDIKPIITANCNASGCHNAGSSFGDFSTYAGLKAKADNGAINNRVVQGKNMPPSGPLPQDQIDKIKCWLDSGSPNN